MSYAILMNRKHIKLFADINFISSIYFSKSDLIKCINVPHRNKSSNPANLRIINYKPRCRHFCYFQQINNTYHLSKLLSTRVKQAPYLIQLYVCYLIYSAIGYVITLFGHGTSWHFVSCKYPTRG